MVFIPRKGDKDLTPPELAVNSEKGPKRLSILFQIGHFGAFLAS